MENEPEAQKSRKSRKGTIFLTVFLLLCLAAALSIGLVLHFENKPEKIYSREGVVVDCHPDPGANKESCQNRGCEWRKFDHDEVPNCLYTRGNSGYYVDNAKSNDQQIRLVRRGVSTVFGMDVKEHVVLTIQMYSDDVVRLKFVPEGESPYEVPREALDMGPGLPSSSNIQYRILVQDDPFSIQVVRNKTGSVIFETAIEGILFADQFLQLTTRLASDRVYGFGEHNHRRFQHDMKWKTWSIFTRDVGPIDAWNLYGAQPVYMNLETDGNANMVFLKNSNAMEVTLQPSPYPAITYRVIGGVLDFYVFMGPTPTQAIAQYNKAIGLPVMPPYWALGFHLCRWHYGNLSHVKQVVERNQLAGIPQDVQWGDIDYMFEKLDFTYDRATYRGLPEFVDQLHQQGQKYIVIVDPGIGNEEDKIKNASINSPGYEMYNDGVRQGVFVNSSDGSILQGEVWPGRSAYPDFTNAANTQSWWTQYIKFFRESERVEVDGLWVDMNEVANFVKGSQTGCSRNKWNNPPYAPNILGRDENNTLYDKTICMDSLQAWGRHYDVHSLYGHSMSMMTNRALKQLMPDKRPLVITRSNFAGTSHYAAHWLGDNQSRWPNLAWSVIGIMEYSIFGFPLVGADICGFWYEAEYEMCIRWQQLGAFYPFSRNHNAHNDPGKPEFRDQDPAAWGDEFVRMVKGPLNTRYKLLPYLYTLMHRAHVYGETVARPFMFQFPSDSVAAAVDRQFMWGSGLLITPVLDEGHRTVEAYFPKSRWYDYYTGEIVQNTGTWHTLDAPLDTINLHVQGGNILPWQMPANTTVYSRKNAFGLLIALSENYTATGELYWDDGDSAETFESGNYLSLRFSVNRMEQLDITVSHDGYRAADGLSISYIEIYGLGRNPSVVRQDGKEVQISSIGSVHQIIKIGDLDLQLTKNHTVTWTTF